MGTVSKLPTASFLARHFSCADVYGMIELHRRLSADHSLNKTMATELYFLTSDDFVRRWNGVDELRMTIPAASAVKLRMLHFMSVGIADTLVHAALASAQELMQVLALNPQTKIL